MTTPSQTVTTDHLDLLITAATHYQLLDNPVTAALTHAPAMTPDTAATILCSEQFAALRWRSDRGRQTPEVSGRLYGYRHRAVAGRLDPVEIIKACHCYRQLSADSPGWAGSAACELLERILLAATCRVPGYDTAPWHWTRPHPRNRPPVGLRRRWTPPLAPVTWLDPEALRQAWNCAAHIVLTLEALPDLPDGLPPRPAVYLVCGEYVPAAAWEAITAGAAAALVMLPVGLPWLLEQLAQGGPR